MERFGGDQELRKSRIELLKKQFKAFNHLNNESFGELVSRFSKLIRELKEFGKTYTFTKVNTKLLDSLPSKWEFQVMLLKDDKKLPQWPLEELIGKLQAYEMEMEKRPDEGIKEKLLNKDEEIQALQSQILTMETEREMMRSIIVGQEKIISKYEDQQKEMGKIKSDHDLALKTVQDLREQISKSLKSVKKKKKISAEKSSEPLLKVVRDKKISQFTTYSLQKDKKYSEKLQSTRRCKHQKVDCDDSGYSIRSKSSVFRQKLKTAFIPTQQPESGHTKSCAYTRAQMFALAPPRSKHMVQKRRKDFVPFTPIKFNSELIPRKHFRHETTRFNFRWNSMSLDYIDESYRRFSKLKTQIGTVLKWVPKIIV